MLIYILFHEEKEKVTLTASLKASTGDISANFVWNVSFAAQSASNCKIYVNTKNYSKST